MNRTLLIGLPRIFRQHVPVMGDVLAGGDDGHHIVMVDIADARLRFEIGMLDLLGGVGLLDDQVGLGEARLDIALADRDVLDEVARRIGVEHRRAGLHRVLGVEDRRERGVVDPDAAQRFLGGDDILGGDRRDALADIADHAPRHDRLVMDEDPEIVLARHVVAGDDAAIAGEERLGLARCRWRRYAHGHAASAAPACAACPASPCRRHSADGPRLCSAHRGGAHCCR